MSSLTHIFGELDRPKIECAADEPCIWIRGRHDTVSLTLNREQRQKLRAALDECDQFDAPVVPAAARVLADVTNSHVSWEHAIFEGEAPAGYDNWIEWVVSRRYSNVVVRASAKKDLDVNVVGEVEFDESNYKEKGEVLGGLLRAFAPPAPSEGVAIAAGLVARHGVTEVRPMFTPEHRARIAENYASFANAPDIVGYKHGLRLAIDAGRAALDTQAAAINETAARTLRTIQADGRGEP